MKNKKILYLFTALFAVFILTGAFSMTVYADGVDDSDTYETETILYDMPETPQGDNVKTLTPDGNMYLVDDINEKAAEDKQFITVETKNGNYFYIIIDRSGGKDENVYFLNKVDEADLTALLKDDNSTAETAAPECSCSEKCEIGNINAVCPVCSINIKECKGKELSTSPEETTQPENKKSDSGGALITVLVLAGIGGGAFYYFKVLRPKQNQKGNDLDEFDFDEYGEEPEEQTEEDTEQY